MESDANLIATPELDTRGARRLVIRVVFPKESIPAPAPRGMNKRALLLIAGAAALLLSWIGVGLFSGEPSSAPADSAPTPTRAEAVPAVSVEPKPTTPAPTSAEMEQPNTPPTAINAVVPDVPRSALDTIRGTIRVSMRVTIAKDGAVVAAATNEPGPSRYFERLAREASRKWTFTPTATNEQRIMLVKFYYTRAGVKANAEAPQ